MSVCYLYVIEVTCGAQVSKIGISSNPVSRLSTLQTASPFNLRISRQWKFDTRDEARKMEATLHYIFEEARSSGEWFQVLPDYISAAILGVSRDRLGRTYDDEASVIERVRCFVSKNTDRLLGELI